MSEQPEPFDPSEPFQIMCEHFRRTVLMACEEAGRTTVFRELPYNLQLSAIIVGSLTGIIQGGFSYGDLLPPDKRAAFQAGIVNAVKDSISHAEFQATTCERAL